MYICELGLFFTQICAREENHGNFDFFCCIFYLLFYNLTEFDSNFQFWWFELREVDFFYGDTG